MAVQPSVVHKPVTVDWWVDAEDLIEELDIEIDFSSVENEDLVILNDDE